MQEAMKIDTVNAQTLRAAQAGAGLTCSSAILGSARHRLVNIKLLGDYFCTFTTVLIY